VSRSAFDLLQTAPSGEGQKQTCRVRDPCNVETDRAGICHGIGRVHLVDIAALTAIHLIRACATDEQIVSARIVDGLLVSEHRSRYTTIYHVHSSTDTLPGTTGTTKLLTSHPVRSGWHIVVPADAKIQGSRAEIPLIGATTRVVEERIQSRRYALMNLSEELLASFTSNRTIDATVRRTLRNVATLQQTVTEHARTRRLLEERRDTIFRDQERISANMRELDRDASLYRRYSSTLEQQEEELNRLQTELATVRDREEQARSALREYLRALGTE